MSEIAGTRPALRWAVHASVLFLVVLWVVPTLGLFISSFRTADQIATSGWWRAIFPSEQNLTLRSAAPDTQVQENGLYVIEGNLFDAGTKARISKWGISSREIDAFEPGQTAELRKGGTITVQANGDYRMENAEEFTGSRGTRVFVTAELPPEFTLDNYHKVLLAEDSTDSMAKAFFNTLTVTIPATIIPILVAAFAAYALAWMDFPGRALLIAAVVGLLVVPLQLALIPLLKFHLNIGIGKGYLGVWLAHTGFGMPLASFAIFQFLWTWNDLLVAKVFLIDASGETTVMTNSIVELLGTRGGNWEILATAAFVSIAVPLVVFFAMQKYLVRGLLAGSVK